MSYLSAIKSIESALYSLKKGLDFLRTKENAKPLTISSRESVIEKLNFGFTELNSQIIELQNQKDNLLGKYNHLHRDTEKLIMFLVLTGVDPNIIFLDKHNSINSMYDNWINTPKKLRKSRVSKSEIWENIQWKNYENEIDKMDIHPEALRIFKEQQKAS